MIKLYQKALIIIILIFLFLFVIAFARKTPRKSDNDYSESPTDSQDPPNNRWLFPDCPGITAKFLDLHPDFKNNPNLLRSWAKQHLTYWEIKDWLENGFRSDDGDFVRWIMLEKTKQITDFSVKVKYKYPSMLKEIANIDDLRNEYKEWKRNNN